VIVACGREPVVDLDPPGLRQLVHTRLLDCADERTPRFFKDGDGRFAVRREPDVDGERWIRVERPDATIRYRLDVRGRIGAVERLDRQCQRFTVIEEYARATPGRVLCLEVGDHATRDLLERIIVDEEHHIDWIEAQQHKISEVGYQQYLAQQIYA
jgi:hypothetical protein